MTGFTLRRIGKPEPMREAAAAWVLAHEEGPLGESARTQFAAWLAEDRLHELAYDDAMWALDAAARHAAEPEMLALRSAALLARRTRPPVWNWIGGVGLIAASLIAMLLWSRVPNVPSRPAGTVVAASDTMVDGTTGSYRTGIGERSAIQLPDGSVVTLDTDSRVKVAYTSRERAVFLLQGQALFNVAHGKPTPFQVYAGGQRITAVGTVFNVRIDGKQVRVSMVEGTVKVRPLSQPGESSMPVEELTLTAGEALVAAPAKPMTVAPIDAQQVASWKGGLLVFNDTPLADAVAEINRYTTRPIAIADISIGALRVTGVFKTNDPEHFSQAMAEVLPVTVTHAPDGAPALRRRGD